MFDVKLMNQGPNKITTIKALRTALQPMGLLDAKNYVDNAPIIIARGVTSREVQDIRLAFSGVADLSVMAHLDSGFFNKISVTVPETGDVWVKVGDLKIGEIVSCIHPGKSGRDDLRLITSQGAFSFEGRFVAELTDDVYYQRLPIGTTVLLTVV